MSDTQLSRRRLVAGLGTAAGAVALGAGCGSSAKSKTTTTTPAPGAQFPHPATPDAALDLLRAGNQRYRNSQVELRDFSPVTEQAAKAQKPFAAIITCADSRISPTLLFDIAAGNLFVSRVAGNTIDEGMLGSTEYAVAKLGVKVVVVMGHSDCGAVKAAIGVADGSAHFPADHYGSIGAVVDRVVPVVNGLPAGQRTLERATTANASAQAKKLAAKEPVIAPAVAAGKLRVVSTVYDIASGQIPL
ncbi:MAG: carbonic anhydrase [Actinobacteria bacterium]|nr:MAG: carbonic anhydrase [Actinomycetota bacterium]